jgi:hypothetical protein
MDVVVLSITIQQTTALTNGFEKHSNPALLHPVELIIAALRWTE